MTFIFVILCQQNSETFPYYLIRIKLVCLLRIYLCMAAVFAVNSFNLVVLLNLKWMDYILLIVNGIANQGLILSLRMDAFLHKLSVIVLGL